MIVSVVITTYNTGAYVCDALDSVFAQTHDALDVIVVDDGSTDDTTERIQRYRGRLTYVQRPHGGLAAARNAGLALARGEFIALLDADDVWRPEKIATQLEVAARHPASGLIVCDGVEFAGDRVTRRSLVAGAPALAMLRSRSTEATADFHRAFIDHVSVRCPAQTLMPKRVIEAIGPFRDFDAQDYDYYLRVSARFPVTFHRHSLVGWRDRPDSMSGPASRRLLRWSLQTLAVLRAHDREESRDPRRLARRLVQARAEAAVHYGEAINRRRARRAIVGLWRRHPWPPTTLAYFVATGAPAAARSVHDGWVRVMRRWAGPKRLPRSFLHRLEHDSFR